MNYWQIALLLLVGAIVGFVFSAKMTSRYYIGVGMAIILHAYNEVSRKLEMKDQLDILAEDVSKMLHTEKEFRMVMDAARRTVKDAMFK